MKSPDFQGFLNKLSEEQRNELNNLSYSGTQFMLRKPFLALKIDEEFAMSVLTAMLSSVMEDFNMKKHTEKYMEFAKAESRGLLPYRLLPLGRIVFSSEGGDLHSSFVAANLR